MSNLIICKEDEEYMKEIEKYMNKNNLKKYDFIFKYGTNKLINYKDYKKLYIFIDYKFNNTEEQFKDIFKNFDSNNIIVDVLYFQNYFKIKEFEEKYNLRNINSILFKIMQEEKEVSFKNFIKGEKNV